MLLLLLFAFVLNFFSFSANPAASPLIPFAFCLAIFSKFHLVAFHMHTRTLVYTSILISFSMQHLESTLTY